ncbi:GIY-YIG nuclease family protein [Streptococcus pasteurianus]
MTKLTLKQQRFADEYIIGEVYCIENLKNQKKYIGITTRTISERFKEHCKADTAIGRAIRKYGKNNFFVYKLDSAKSKQELFDLEKYYIKKYDSYHKGYNSTIGGDGVVKDMSIDVVLTERQLRFVNYVEKKNKEVIDVNDANQMIISVVLNISNLFLLCDSKKEKRECAKLLLTLSPSLLKKVLNFNLFSLEELRGWASWRSTLTG